MTPMRGLIVDSFSVGEDNHPGQNAGFVDPLSDTPMFTELENDSATLLFR